MPEIVKIKDKKSSILRKTISPFDFASTSRKETTELINRMKKIMRQANGIGLSANQIGLNARMFVAEVPHGKNGLKFYAVFNPKIEKVGGEEEEMEEGCLSIPDFYGKVTRPAKITLSCCDKNQKPVRIKAWGLLARVFQHEIDHLNGKLFIDRAKKIERSKNI